MADVSDSTMSPTTEPSKSQPPHAEDFLTTSTPIVENQLDNEAPPSETNPKPFIGEDEDLSILEMDLENQGNSIDTLATDREHLNDTQLKEDKV